MSKPMSAIDFPEVTVEDAQRFERVVRIDDEDAFVAELNALIREKFATAGPSPRQIDTDLRSKARPLQAESNWEPTATEMQRGRAALLRAYDVPGNIPLPEFARLAHKSRQQVYKDLSAQPRRLLSLDVGRRGQRLPDWQLDPLKLKVTREVLKRAASIDSWTLFRALSSPDDSLGGHSPIETVKPSNFERIFEVVMNVLARAEQTLVGTAHERAGDVSPRHEPAPQTAVSSRLATDG